MMMFYFNVTASTEIYAYCHTLSLHDALPIWRQASPIPWPQPRDSCSERQGIGRWSGRSTTVPAGGAGRGVYFLSRGFSKCCLSRASATWFAGVARSALPETAGNSRFRGPREQGARSTFRQETVKQQGRLIHVYFEGLARGQRPHRYGRYCGYRRHLGRREAEGLRPMRRIHRRAGFLLYG